MCHTRGIVSTACIVHVPWFEMPKSPLCLKAQGTALNGARLTVGASVPEPSASQPDRVAVRKVRISPGLDVAVARPPANHAALPDVAGPASMRGPEDGMEMVGIPFAGTDWSEIPATEHPGETGVALWRTIQLGTIRVRTVEYSPGYAADHWCKKGHGLLCLTEGQEFPFGRGGGGASRQGIQRPRVAAVEGHKGCDRVRRGH